jgi:hypothetical protein
MPTVHAEFQDRKRIVFTARDRSIVNVRERIADGLIGYDSTELLLITLGNCTLGWLLSNRLLKDEEVIRAEMAEAPIRVAKRRSTSRSRSRSPTLPCSITPSDSMQPAGAPRSATPLSASTSVVRYASPQHLTQPDAGDPTASRGATLQPQQRGVR